MNRLSKVVLENIEKNPSGVLDKVLKEFPKARHEEQVEALKLACIKGHLPLLEWFNQSTLHPITSVTIGHSRETLLMVACSAPSLPSVQYLLGQGADVHQTNSFQETALSNACWASIVSPERLQVTRLLLEKGVDVHERSSSGETPGVLVCQSSDSLEMLHLLLEFGLDIQEVTESGTVLSMAYAYGRSKIFKALLEMGADVNAKDPISGATWLEVAGEAMGSHEVQTILETHLAQMKLQNVLPGALQTKSPSRL